MIEIGDNLKEVIIEILNNIFWIAVVYMIIKFFSYE